MAKILLIEDEEAVREILVDELTSQGHNVIEASNGEDGLRIFVDDTPDLVLCDRAMPGMSGYDVLEQIRNQHYRHRNIPFVFLTALTDPRDKSAVDHLQPADYIEKPVNFNMLAEKIKALILMRSVMAS